MEELGAEDLHLRPINGLQAYLALSPGTEEAVKAAAEEGEK